MTPREEMIAAGVLRPGASDAKRNRFVYAVLFEPTPETDRREVPTLRLDDVGRRAAERERRAPRRARDN